MTENKADSPTSGILSSTRRRLSLGEVPHKIMKQEHLDEIRGHTAFQRLEKFDQLDEERKMRDLLESTQTANPEEYRRIQTHSSKPIALLCGRYSFRKSTRKSSTTSATKKAKRASTKIERYLGFQQSRHTINSMCVAATRFRNNTYYGFFAYKRNQKHK